MKKNEDFMLLKYDNFQLKSDDVLLFDDKIQLRIVGNHLLNNKISIKSKEIQLNYDFKSSKEDYIRLKNDYIRLKNDYIRLKEDLYLMSDFDQLISI